MTNRLLGKAASASPQGHLLAEARRQARSGHLDFSDLVPATRTVVERFAETYVDRGVEAAVTVPGRRPAGLSFHGWLATLACIAVELFLVLLRLRGDDAVLVYSYFAVVGTVLAAIDIAVMRLPDWLTLPSYPAILGLLGFNAYLFGDGAAMIRAVEAAVVVLGLFLMLCLFTDTGLGDVLTELAAMKPLPLSSQARD